MPQAPDVDVFVCFASEDRALARALAHELDGRGVTVWIDERGLAGGDPVRRTIETVIRRCTCAAVVLSGSFFQKEWPQRELDGLFQREIRERRSIVVPILHGLTIDEVCDHAPMLATRLALRAANGVASIAVEITRLVAIQDDLTRDLTARARMAGATHPGPATVEVVACPRCGTPTSILQAAHPVCEACGLVYAA